MLLWTPWACAPDSFTDALPGEPAIAASAPATRPPLAPEAFWWGVSSAAYQVEEPAVQPGDAGYFQTDWDLFVARKPTTPPKGQALQGFSSTARDIAALQALGVNSYRFGVEWARVEPQPGVYNPSAVAHYVQFARDLRAAGIEPIVCLWHFTFPDWLSALDRPAQHGWLHPDAPARWAAYVQAMASAFGDAVQVYAPQNEPNTQSALGYLASLFPPGAALDFGSFDRNTAASAQAFRDAAAAIRQARPGATILCIQSANAYIPASFDPFGVFYRLSQQINFEHIDRIVDAVDVVGINYYFRDLASPFALFDQANRIGEQFSAAGWPIDPPSLYEQIRVYSARYGKPVAIMENGIAATSEAQRASYVAEHVAEVQRARDDGYDVRGYFYWTLGDAWEWVATRPLHYGLHEFSADGQTFTPRPAALLYADLILQDRATRGSAPAPASP